MRFAEYLCPDEILRLADEQRRDDKTAVKLVKRRRPERTQKVFEPFDGYSRRGARTCPRYESYTMFWSRFTAGAKPLGDR